MKDATMVLPEVIAYLRNRRMHTQADILATNWSTTGTMVPSNQVKQFCDNISPKLFRELECEVTQYLDIQTNQL